MAEDQARELRQQGILSAKAGNKEEARRLLQKSIRLEPTSEPAWLWLASVARDPQERLFCIQKLLEINPNHELGRQALDSIQASSPSIKSISGVFIQPPSPQTIDTSTPVPTPTPDQIAEAQRQADAVIRAYQNAAVSPVRWTHKTRGRAGERDSVVLRAQIAAAIIVALIAIGGLGTLFVLTNAEARAVLFAPTWTMTFTPTATSTSTPGLTPTPSATPALTLTPSPTVSVSITPWNQYFPPHSTEVYPRVESVQLQHAIEMVDRGDIAAAMPTLQAERLAVKDLFKPAPFYYQAIAQVKAGDGEAALRTLQDAEAGLNPVNTTGYKPVIDAGYGIVYMMMGEQALASGKDAEARADLASAQERANAALPGDPHNPNIYLVLARSSRLLGDNAAALSILDRALAEPELVTDTALIVEKGEVYLAQKAYDDAAQQAFYALYIDANCEAAHLLRIRVALEDNNPGLAVLNAQTYLFYYPGSALGYKLLGDARVQEGNFELALAAYTQALQAPESDATVPVLLARADLYESERRYDLARADLSKAFDLSDDPAIRAKRMSAAYRAGKYQEATDDADALLGTGVLPDAELNLMKARVLVDTAEQDDNATYQKVVGLLGTTADLSPDDANIAHAYLARAQLALGNETAALQQVDAALLSGETASLHYLRGQILEAQGEKLSAVKEYEWVLTWSEVYPLSFRVDAENALESLVS